MPEMLERRYYPCEIRKQGKGRKFEGYASVFGSWSQDLGGFREIVRKGAFSKTIQEADVRATFNHDPNFVLGRRSSGTLALDEDEKGLHFVIDPPDTQWARDLEVSLERGDINQTSFAFRTIKDNWYTEEGENRRELMEVSLHNGDVSVVTYPAYEQTMVGVRSDWARTLVRIERGLPLTEEDARLLASLPRPEAAEPASDHSAEEPAAEPVVDHSYQRRRLRVLELSIL